MTISRRVFVRSGGMALFSLGLDPLFLARAALNPSRLRPPPSAPVRPVLVCLFQRGAVDGLSMIVPHGDPVYYRERPRIAIPRQTVIDLDGHFGLHPALAPLRPWWDDRTLGVVHAVGSPHPTRSHFDAQDYMETGRPGVNSTPDGWLNRYCRHDREHEETPCRAVAFGPRLPRMLAGTAPALAVDDLQVPAGSPRGVEYPRGGLGRSLFQIARLIKADVGLEIAVADVGGWDTHVNQGAAEGQLAARLRELAHGLAAFARDLGEQMGRVVVLTMSEFGRTVRENGNGGTDHGHATAMLVLGGPVAGGRVLGRWPGLDPADRFAGRDLAVTTDFRDLFGEVLARHLGATDLRPVFPGYEPQASRFVGVIST
ncbi:MAG: DUF1501 domain-containing protein [Gemmatimonadales bacterium]